MEIVVVEEIAWVVAVVVAVENVKSEIEAADWAQSSLVFV